MTKTAALANTLYISGLDRSGSTLLGALLAPHPAICYLGEAHNFRRHIDEGRPCSCGALIPECPFWRRVIERLGDDADGLSPLQRADHWGRAAKLAVLGGRAGLGALSLAAPVVPPLRAQLDAWRDHARLHQVAAELTGAQVVCDGSKRDLPARLFALHAPERTYVVHLVRDGRGTINSWLKHVDLTVAQAARQWVRSNVYTLCALAGLRRDRVLRVRYEDLCAAPEEILGRITRFAGLADFEDVPEVSADQLHFIGGSPGFRARRDRRITLDEAWRRWTPAQLRDFERIAGPLNRYFGYPRTPQS